MRTFIILVALTGIAHAQPADDGYCDYVEGVASATSAVQLSPELIGQFGYIDQSISAVNPSTSSTLRAIGGVRYRLTGIYEGFATRAHADADCKRHRALEQVRGETQSRALAAKIAILDPALAEAEKVLAEVTADMEARRTTAQEATALRLRVEELRQLAADAHSQLSALPAASNTPLGAAMVAYHEADADMEVNEAKLRRAQAVNVEVRAGLDQFIDSGTTQYFAVLQLGVNIGALFQGSGNSRAAAGRKRLIETGHDPLGVDATLERVQTEITVETKRSQETGALVGELNRQLDALAKIPGDDAKRYRQTVWFDFIKAKADKAYLDAHVASLREVLGGQAAANAGGGEK